MITWEVKEQGADKMEKSVLCVLRFSLYKPYVYAAQTKRGMNPVR